MRAPDGRDRLGTKGKCHGRLVLLSGALLRGWAKLVCLVLFYLTTILVALPPHRLHLGSVCSRGGIRQGALLKPIPQLRLRGGAGDGEKPDKGRRQDSRGGRAGMRPEFRKADQRGRAARVQTHATRRPRKGQQHSKAREHPASSAPVTGGESDIVFDMRTPEEIALVEHAAQQQQSAAEGLEPSSASTNMTAQAKFSGAVEGKRYVSARMAEMREMMNMTLASLAEAEEGGGEYKQLMQVWESALSA